MRRNHHHPSQSNSYYLCGGVSIETGTKQSELFLKNEDLPNGTRSVLNEYMQVLGVELFEEKGLVEVKL